VRGSAVVMLVLLGFGSVAGATTQVHYVMGTFLRVTVDDEVAPGIFDACFARAHALDRTFSRYDATSELVRVNAAGGGAVSDMLRVGLAQARTLGRATGGTFDVSAGAVTALWRVTAPPTAAAIAAARRSVGGVAVNGDRIVLEAGTLLDFDGFAKGVAVDACVNALRAEGVTRAFVSFGESSLYAIGAPRGARAWVIDVRGPTPDVAVARLRLRDVGAAVSAVFGGAGRGTAGQRAHIVDPRTGRPLAIDAASVVVAPRAADAEAYAKAVLVRGDRGVVAVERHAGILAARILRDRVDVGRAMRAAGALQALARPRWIGGEVVLR